MTTFSRKENNDDERLQNLHGDLSKICKKDIHNTRIIPTLITYIFIIKWKLKTLEISKKNVWVANTF